MYKPETGVKDGVSRILETLETSLFSQETTITLLTTDSFWFRTNLPTLEVGTTVWSSSPPPTSDLTSGHRLLTWLVRVQYFGGIFGIYYPKALEGPTTCVAPRPSHRTSPVPSRREEEGMEQGT